MNRKKSALKSILLVDDSQNSLNLYSELLRKKSNAEVICAKHPDVAIKLANKHFFDIILIDVTIDYKGTQFGGLEVYKSLKGRYGDSSFIVYSQYITEDFLKEYEYESNFIEKQEDPRIFVDECLKMADSLRLQQTCFIAMPFSPGYNDVFHIIKSSIQDTSYKCIRIDERQFTKSIVQKIFSEIENAKLIIFLATDQNPNSFYECGYSVALNKEVITVTDSFDHLPFDIRDRNAISYGKNLQMLATSLNNKLSNLTLISSQ